LLKRQRERKGILEKERLSKKREVYSKERKDKPCPFFIGKHITMVRLTRRLKIEPKCERLT